MIPPPAYRATGRAGGAGDPPSALRLGSERRGEPSPPGSMMIGFTALALIIGIALIANGVGTLALGFVLRRVDKHPELLG